MAAAGDFLACDWGTTRLRAWRLGADGAVVDRRDFPFGVARLAAGEAGRLFSETVRPALDARGLPAVLCGMIGSTLGWREAAYVDCPAGPEALAAAALRIETEAGPAVILPGLRGAGVLTAAPDVMRGEETKILGWAAGVAGRGGAGPTVVCMPGTHPKWALVDGGAIRRFVTAMTGELFDLLRRSSTLRSDAVPDDPGAFAEGLAAAGDGGALAARLFSARSRLVGGGAAPASAAAYLSGLLVGAEVAGLLAVDWIAAAPTIALIAGPELAGLYGAALAAHGRTAAVFEGDAAVLAGLRLMRERLFP